MKLILTKINLNKTPCERYDDLPIIFDAIYEIEKRGCVITDISWLFVNCVFAQTEEMIDYFLSKKPSAFDVSWLLINCPFTQKQKMLDYFMTINAPPYDISLLISKCVFAQTEEMIDYFISQKPSGHDISWVIQHCPALHTQKIIDYYKTENTSLEISWFDKNLNFKSKIITT